MDGHTLKVERVKLGLSQVELAERLGVTQNTMSRWESGAVAIRHRVIMERALRDVAVELERERLGVEPKELPQDG